jgi:O-antigen/teichoic acid export membrane protein
MLVMFSYVIAMLWTQDPVTAERSYLLISILSCGTALNGLMNVPYALQLAHGWTQLALSANIVAVIVLVPMSIFLTSLYGAVGAASVWVILNSGYVVVSIHFMHKRLLKQEKWLWYLHDVLVPLAVSVAVCGMGRWLIPMPHSDIVKVMYLLGLLGAALAITSMTTRTTREWALCIAKAGIKFLLRRMRLMCPLHVRTISR